MNSNKIGYAKAHTNIALIKYWGKADDQLILPANDSISLTLDQFYTETTVEFDSNLSENQLNLNGNLVPKNKLNRVNNVISRVQTEFGVDTFAKIDSTNFVPTSAGLASSASGMAALAGAAVSAVSDDNIDLKNLSRIARLGSGSATRSIFGGFVRWHRGYDHLSSYAEPLDQASHDLHMITVVVNKHAKKILSTYGMQHTAKTSPFYSNWVVESNLMADQMQNAILASDFTRIGELSEHSATMMHATTWSSNPAFTYFEPQTLTVINLVNELRHTGIECYYTIDAGPNVKILTQTKNITTIKKALLKYFTEKQLIVASAGPNITLKNN